MPQSKLIVVVRRRPIMTIVLVTLVLIVGFILWSFVPSPLPAPAPWTGALPPVSSPPDMTIYQLPTGTYRTNAGLAFRGGSFFDSRDFAATAILVHHPKGDLLFDAGFGAAIDAQIQELPSYMRAPYQRGETARAQLAASGYDFSQLQGIVITHAHWDHVSGLQDFAAPVWMNVEEERFAREDRPDTRVFRNSPSVKIRTYSFDGPAYFGFVSSHDVWGDGSIVLVPAPGHTPGSIVAFITLPTGQRFALIGDITWQLDGIYKRAERPLLLRAVADTDPDKVRENLERMIALAGVVQIIPAHDGRGYAGIPRLGVVPTELSKPGSTP